MSDLINELLKRTESIEDVRAELVACKAQLADSDRSLKFSRNAQQDYKAKLEMFEEIYETLIEKILSGHKNRD